MSLAMGVVSKEADVGADKGVSCPRPREGRGEDLGPHYIACTG